MTNKRHGKVYREVNTGQKKRNCLMTGCKIKVEGFHFCTSCKSKARKLSLRDGA